MSDREAIKKGLDDLEYMVATGEIETPALFTVMKQMIKAAQAQASKPIAAVHGWFHGECVIRPLDPEAVLPAGMALYSQPQAQAGEHKSEGHISKPMTIELVKYIGLNGAYASKKEVMYKARRIGVDGSASDLMGFMSEGYGYISREYAHQDALREHLATGWPIIEVDLTGGRQ